MSLRQLYGGFGRLQVDGRNDDAPHASSERPPDDGFSVLSELRLLEVSVGIDEFDHRLGLLSISGCSSFLKSVSGGRSGLPGTGSVTRQPAASTASS